MATRFATPTGSLACPDEYVRPSLAHLLTIGLDSVLTPPLNPITSFLGTPGDWIPPYDFYSEFNIIDPLHAGRALNYLLAIGVPSFSGAAPRLIARLLPPLVTDLFWQQTEVIPPRGSAKDCGNVDTEQWFFINGILTNSDVARLNADCLTYLFHRPVTLIQNATDGLVLDTIETSLGKEWSANTESATVAFPAIHCALKDSRRQRVVVVGHSQGTIIMAVVLRALKALGQKTTGARARAGAGYEPRYCFEEQVRLRSNDFDPLTEAEWAKLEYYCFANAASEMRYHCPRPDGSGLPHIESFGNENDFVARLGMLAPDMQSESIHIDGPRYLRPGIQGHLLNEYYLLPIARCWHVDEGNARALDARPFLLMDPERYPWAQVPRLFRYLDGGAPPCLAETPPIAAVAATP